MEHNYELVQAYLRRHLRELEVEEPDQEDMARQGMSYAMRQHMMDRYKADKELTAKEVEAYESALDIVRDYERLMREQKKAG